MIRLLRLGTAVLEAGKAAARTLVEQQDTVCSYEFSACDKRI